MVWAEILLGPSPKQRLDLLAKYDLVFGMFLPDIYANLSCLNEEEIQEFQPVIDSKSDLYGKYMQRMLQSPDNLMDQARSQKQLASIGSAKLITKIRGFSKSYKDAKSRGQHIKIQKFATIDEVMPVMAKVFETQLLSDVTNYGKRLMRATSADSLYQAVMSNMYLARFLRLLACMHVGYGHNWQDEALNIDPSENRNDRTDMVLGLYAGDGDIIVTQDRKLRNALRCIDPLGQVNIKTWDECENLIL